MLKKFVEGLLFGCGFSIAFVVIWLLVWMLVLPLLLDAGIGGSASVTHSERIYHGLGMGDGSSADREPEPILQFYEMTLEEQIQHASVIAVASYEDSPEGEQKVIIREFLKKDPGVIIHYDIGDEYRFFGSLSREDAHAGDGMVIFFTGSPASFRMSSTFTGERIHGLGDLPLALLREKCAQAEASD